MLIGILQTGQSPEALREKSGDYPEMYQRLLAGHGFDFRVWHVEGLDFPQDVHAADGWLITGSRHGAYEDHGFIPRLEDFVRRAYADKVPMVGICFGHQIIAQALGGKVEEFAGGWAVGAQDYDFNGEKVTLNAWHRDQVTRRPEGAELAGTNAFCENAALIYGDRAFTVQAHPEFEDDFIDGLMQTRGRGLVPAPLMAAAAKHLGQPNSSAKVANRIAEFFNQTRV